MTTVIKPNAVLKLKNGENLQGPITTEDKVTCLFVNKSTDLDAYFKLRKTDDGWHFAGGPEHAPLQEYIDQIGFQIDHPNA